LVNATGWLLCSADCCSATHAICNPIVVYSQDS